MNRPTSRIRRHITLNPLTIRHGRWLPVLMCLVMLTGLSRFPAGSSNVARSANSARAHGLTTPSEMEGLSAEFHEQLRTLPLDSLFSLGCDRTIYNRASSDSAILYYSALILRAEDGPPDKDATEQAVKAYINMAWINSNVRMDAAKSYNCLRRAEKLIIPYLPDSTFSKILAHTYLNLAVAYYVHDILSGESMRKGNGGWTYLVKAFDMAEKAGSCEVMAAAIYNMSNSWFLDHEKELAAYVDRYLTSPVMKRCGKHGFTDKLAHGLKAYYAGDYQGALRLFTEMAALPWSRNALPEEMRDYSLLMRAFTHEKLGDNAEAERLLHEMYASASARRQPYIEQAYADILADFFTRRGNQAEADRFRLQAFRLRQKMTSSGMLANLNEIDLREDLEEYTMRLEAERHRSQRNLILGVAGAVVLLLVIIVLTISLRFARRRTNYIRTLYEKNREFVAPSESDLPPVHAPESSPAPESAAQQTPVPRELTDKERELKEAIFRFLDESPEVFNPDFSMANLCKAVESNSTYVSRIINACSGKNFKNLVSERRIRQACRLLDNPADSDLFTIEAICQQVGFRSRAGFSIAFKAQTGLTPTEYRGAARRYAPRADVRQQK